MARFNLSYGGGFAFTKKIEASLHSITTRALDELNGVKICAGTRDLEKDEKGLSSVDKAMISHFGTETIPQRQFITAATMIEEPVGQNSDLGDLRGELKEIVKQSFQDTQQRSFVNKTYKGEVIDEKLEIRERPLGAGNTPRRIVNRIGNKMLDNQKKAFNNVVENADSTFYWKASHGYSVDPLKQTERLYESLEWWVDNG